MDSLKHNLQALGLSEEEIIIYMSTIESGAETILHISQTTGIPRTTVYLLIESLLQKGFLILHEEGKKKKYIPASPDALVNYAQRQKAQLVETIDNIHKDLPQLSALYNLKHNKPQIRYGQGNGEVRKILEHTLQAKELYLYLASTQGPVCMSEEWTQYLEKVKKHMIPTREIVPDNLTGKAYHHDSDNSRNQVRCQSESLSTETDFIIAGDSFIYITYKDETPHAVAIHDAQLAYFEKVRFNLLWDTL